MWVFKLLYYPHHTIQIFLDEYLKAREYSQVYMNNYYKS